MPFYKFEDKNGKKYDVIVASAEQCSEKYPMMQWCQMPGPNAPVLRRVWTVPQGRANTTQGAMEIHCMQMPKWLPEAPHHDEMGRAVLTSRREKEEFAAKTGAIDGQGIEKDHWNDD